MSNFKLKNLKKYRTLRHYSQEQMANFLKISRPTYNDIESGTREITLDQLEALILSLRVKLADIMDIPKDSQIFTNLNLTPRSPKMSSFCCAKCNYRMSNICDDNDFEYFLIKSNAYNLKQYDKLISRINKDANHWNANNPEDRQDIDTWFDVCLEFGHDAWICPKCKTLHIFETNSNKLKSVYLLEEDYRGQESCQN